MYKLSKKRKRALDLVRWFIPSNCDWKSKWCKLTFYGTVGCSDIKEDDDGLDSIEAFFMRSETGKLPKKVSRLDHLVALLFGQRRMSLYEKLYREDFGKGLLYLSDFKDEPSYVIDFVTKIEGGFYEL